MTVALRQASLLAVAASSSRGVGTGCPRLGLEHGQDKEMNLGVKLLTQARGVCSSK